MGEGGLLTKRVGGEQSSDGNSNPSAYCFYVFVINAPQESLSQQQAGAAEWTILSEGSREQEGLLKPSQRQRYGQKTKVSIGTRAIREKKEKKTGAEKAADNREAVS